MTTYPPWTTEDVSCWLCSIKELPRTKLFLISLIGESFCLLMNLFIVVTQVGKKLSRWFFILFCDALYSRVGNSTIPARYNITTFEVVARLYVYSHRSAMDYWLKMSCFAVMPITCCCQVAHTTDFQSGRTRMTFLNNGVCLREPIAKEIIIILSVSKSVRGWRVYSSLGVRVLLGKVMCRTQVHQKNNDRAKNNQGSPRGFLQII